jgi:TM2 domain-containing membrane protein YozV
MKKNPFIAAFLSLIVPGLGQIYCGEGKKGATIIFAAIVIANLNIIILPLIAMANPNLPMHANNANEVWKYWIPRITHDIASLWSIVFWLWAVIDAFNISGKQ